MSKRVWFYDLETLEIFTATFMDRDSDEIRVFVITDEINQIPDLLEFLSNEVAGLIGYNCLFFDSQILEFIKANKSCKAKDIQEYATLIITSKDRKLDWPEYKLSIKHLDLFKALSLSTSAKRTGLKWCEYSLRMDNVEDMPDDIDLEKVLNYNLYDVIATKRLYYEYEHEIILRRELTIREGISLMNCTEPDLAKKLFSKYLSKEMCISESELRTMQTDRDTVIVSEVLFDYIKFQEQIFKNVFEAFKNLELETVHELDIEEKIVSKNPVVSQLNLF